MSKLKEGTRVVSIEGYSLRKGTVKKMYEDLGIAIVDFDDGDTEKVQLSLLAIEPEPIKSEDTKTTEPVEKSEITITPDEFRKIAIDVIKRESNGVPAIRAMLSRTVGSIHYRLFSIKND